MKRISEVNADVIFYTELICIVFESNPKRAMSGDRRAIFGGMLKKRKLFLA